MGGTIRLLMRLYQKIKGMGKRKSYYESAWAELDFYDSYWGGYITISQKWWKKVFLITRNMA